MEGRSFFREYFSWLAKLLTLVVIFFVVIPVLCISFLAAAQVAVNDKAPDGSKKTVAVVEVKGVIESSKEIVAELYKQADNKKVKGIVLRIDSPGGAVGPSQDIYNAVSKLKGKKPIIASMDSVAASGGLYSALGATKIFCQPGTLTGSVGVIMQIPNFRKIANWAGVDMVTIKSGNFKDVGNSFREMTEEEREYLQSTVLKVQESFVQAVVDGRKIPRDEVMKFADGRIIVGSQAKELKLVDEIGDLHDAAREVFVALGEPLKDDESPDLYYPSDKFSQFKKILEGVTNFTGSFQSSMKMKFEMY